MEVFTTSPNHDALTAEGCASAVPAMRSDEFGAGTP